MIRTTWFIASACAASLLVTSGAAQADGNDKRDKPLPEVFAKVLDCRKLENPEARLTCFDNSVAALETANDQKAVIVMSEETVQEARRGLFGLTLPRLGLFGDSDEDQSLKELTTTITSVRGGDGAWVLTLADGAVWQQTDGAYLRAPKSGESITIRKAALGSYMAKVEGGRGFRIKRAN